MKIAVPVTTDNMIDGHFGHCDSFNVFTISENNKIADIKNLKSPEGCGCKSNIAGDLAADGVTVLLAGGIGGGAINVLNNNGIEVIRGCSGNSEEVVKLFISGLVADSGSSCKQHEHHHHGEHKPDHGHTCGHHN